MKKNLVIITGASSGIGAALAKTFSAAGYPVGLIARNLKAMQDFKLPNSACEVADVTDFNALKPAIKNIENQLGPVDCLVNNAGFAKGGEFTNIDHDDNEAMIKVNLLGTVNGIEAVLPDMQTRKHGTIINIASVADRHSRPMLATYAATKAAVKSLSESLRVANAKHGVRICNVAPAKILTPLLLAAKLAGDNDVINVDDFAKVVLWMYEQPQSICIRDLVVASTYYEN